MSTTDPRTAARDFSEALAALFADYPMADPGEGTLTLTISGHDGPPFQVVGDPTQLAELAALVRRDHENTDRAHPGHPREGVCAHCGQHEDSVQI